MNFTILHNQSLKPYNSLGLNAIADKIVLPHNQQGVTDLFEAFGGGRIILLGKGTNILLSRKHYDSSYLFVSLKLLDSLVWRNQEIIAEAGVSLSLLSWFALENSAAGFEFLEDIPGTVGGGVVMNAGTYKDNIGDVVKRVRYYDIKLGTEIERKVERQDFDRRSSIFNQGGHVILECGFVYYKGNYEESLKKILATKEDRYIKQPRNYPNAGSVFKRPLVKGKEMLVWKLINDAGLRGVQRNGAMISDKHSGFIINTGDSTYDDLQYLIELCQERVKKKFGIELELEWNTI